MRPKRDLQLPLLHSVERLNQEQYGAVAHRLPDKRLLPNKDKASFSQSGFHLGNQPTMHLGGLKKNLVLDPPGFLKLTSGIIRIQLVP